MLLFSGEQEKVSNSVSRTKDENDIGGTADSKSSTPTPVQEPTVVESQAPEPHLTTPSSKGQRNLQDSTFSISGESASGLHDKESGRCVFISCTEYHIVIIMWQTKIYFPFSPFHQILMLIPVLCFFR
jgi:hypothetical protein